MHSISTHITTQPISLPAIHIFVAHKAIHWARQQAQLEVVKVVGVGVVLIQLIEVIAMVEIRTRQFDGAFLIEAQKDEEFVRQEHQ